MFMEETIFKKHPFITGTQPSSLDKSMFELLKYCLYEGMQLADATPIKVSPDDHPQMFGWFNLISHFKDLVSSLWVHPSEFKVSEEDILIVNSLINSFTQPDQVEERISVDTGFDPSVKHPSDEFYDLSLIEKECIEKVDLTEEQDGGLIKYKIKEPTALFERRVEPADHVYYIHETRFDNG